VALKLRKNGEADGNFKKSILQDIADGVDDVIKRKKMMMSQ
jgi:hypothetical protein